MPNGILDQLTGQGAPQESLPPSGMPGPLPAMTPAPAPQEAGGGGFFGALDRGMGAAAQSIDQFSLPVIASMIAMQGGPQALGAFMGGVMEGQFRRQQLGLEQQRIGMQQQGVDIQREGLDIRRGEIEAEREERGERRTERESAEERQRLQAFREFVNQRTDDLRQQLEGKNVREATEMIMATEVAVQTFAETMGMEGAIPADFVSSQFPLSPIQRDELGRSAAVWDAFMEQNKETLGKAYRDGDTETVKEILERHRAAELDPTDPPSMWEIGEQLGRLGEDETGQIVVSLPETEQKKQSWGSGQTLIGPGGKRVPSRIRTETGEVEALDLPEGFSIPEPRGLNIQLDPGVSIREIGPEGETIERRVPKGSPELFEPRVVKPAPEKKPVDPLDLVTDAMVKESLGQPLTPEETEALQRFRAKGQQR